MLHQPQPVVCGYGDEPCGNLDDIEAQVLAFADVVIHGFGTPREHVFDESAGGHQNVVGVAEVDEFPDHPPWHEAEGTGGKLQRIHVATNGFQHVLQVSLAHDGVVGAADFGDSASARFALTLVKLQERERAILAAGCL